MIILAEVDWMWVDASESSTLAHSLFGIFSICLAFIQVKND